MVDHKTGRNDPCPCGSGQKYKNCHLGHEEEITPELARRSRVVPALIGVAGLAGAVAAGMLRGVGAGVTVLVATLLFVGGYMVLSNPPPADPNRKDSGSINFGG